MFFEVETMRFSFVALLHACYIVVEELHLFVHCQIRCRGYDGIVHVVVFHQLLAVGIHGVEVAAYEGVQFLKGVAVGTVGQYTKHERHAQGRAYHVFILSFARLQLPVEPEGKVVEGLCAGLRLFGCHVCLGLLCLAEHGEHQQ